MAISAPEGGGVRFVIARPGSREKVKPLVFYCIFNFCLIFFSTFFVFEASVDFAFQKEREGRVCERESESESERERGRKRERERERKREGESERDVVRSLATLH
jgi:hypothetical protein